jgi:hypothetical protein
MDARTLAFAAQSQWVTITDDPGTLPQEGKTVEIVGSFSRRLASRRGKYMETLMPGMMYCLHVTGDGPIQWREIGPLPAPPKADSSLTK